MAGRFVTIDGRVVFIGGPGAGGGSIVLGGTFPKGKINVEAIDDFMYGNLGPFDGRAERAKDQIVSDIAELSGESYEDVNDVVGQWAQSSNDNDMRSLALQRDAAEEFGIPLSDFTQGKIDAIEEHRSRIAVSSSMVGDMSSDDTIAFIDGILPSSAPLLPSSQQRRILRAMYDNTQAKLAEAGFKHGDRIRLYRGVSIPGDHKTGDAVNLRSNTLSSWSYEKSVADEFASGLGGVVFAMDVPIEMIMGSARSGFGCLDESEFIVLGLPSTADVVDVGE